jgi:hypothetical protein
MLVLAVGLLPSTLRSVPTYYVWPEGDDVNPGSQEMPIRTLERARDLVRTVNQTASDDITVYLAGGAYR